MARRELRHVLLFVLICGFFGKSFAQAPMEALQEIRLPVPSNRGSYARFPIPGMSARDHFSMRVAPDQSILILDSDTTGEWPLVRVRKWWTDHPLNDLLKIPGWGAADAKYICGIYVDVQVTPDGRYAIAFSEAVWNDTSDFLLHVPKGYVGRKPDTIITVIDLDQWKVLKTVHTSTVGDVRIRHARILGNKWIAYDGGTGAPPTEHGVYQSLDQLLSIPDLTAGRGCITQRFSHTWQVAPASLLASVRMQNDAACQKVLAASGPSSTAEMEALIQKGSGVEPTAMMLRDVQWKEEYLEKEAGHAVDEAQRIWDADGESEEFFGDWGEYPLYRVYGQNPPFQASSGSWYGLYFKQDQRIYELARYDAKGEEQGARVATHLLCGNPSLGHPNSACGCRVMDVSEEGHAVLAYCRQQHGDFDGFVQREWLSVLRTDDLSEVGLIDLPKNSYTLQWIARANDHAYVVTLQFGEVLRVYAIADRAE